MGIHEQATLTPSQQNTQLTTRYRKIHHNFQIQSNSLRINRKKEPRDLFREIKRGCGIDDYAIYD